MKTLARNVEPAVVGIAASSVYLTLIAADIHGYVYLPLRKQWTLEPSPVTIFMAWYFRAAVVLLVAIVTALLTRLWSRRSSLVSVRIAQGVWTVAVTLWIWSVLYTALLLGSTAHAA